MIKSPGASLTQSRACFPSRSSHADLPKRTPSDVALTEVLMQRRLFDQHTHLIRDVVLELRLEFAACKQCDQRISGKVQAQGNNKAI